MTELESNEDNTMLYRDGIKKLMEDYARVYRRLNQEMVDLRIERARQPAVEVQVHE